FSQHSRNAFWLACALARDYGARLVVLHVVTAPTVIYSEGVVPPNAEELRAEAQEQLDALQVPRADIRAERRLEEGDVVEVTRRWMSSWCVSWAFPVTRNWRWALSPPAACAFSIRRWCACCVSPTTCSMRSPGRSGGSWSGGSALTAATVRLPMYAAAS